MRGNTTRSGIDVPIEARAKQIDNEPALPGPVGPLFESQGDFVRLSVWPFRQNIFPILEEVHIAFLDNAVAFFLGMTPPAGIERLVVGVIGFSPNLSLRQESISFGLLYRR